MNRVSTLAATGEAAATLGRAIELTARTAATFYRWRRRRKTRTSLDRLDDRMLADIGLNRSDIMAMRFTRRLG